MDSPIEQRRALLASVADDTIDLLVVGGGVTGAGTARHGAWMGYKTVLVERGDFACGTSSRSTKLLHGGLRYLANAQFRLVFESVRERMLNARLAPHLAQPLPILLPHYIGDTPGMAVKSLGLWIYDAMASFRSFGLHQRLSAARIEKEMPQLRKEMLVGGHRFWDAMTNDARLTMELILDATDLGARTLNRTSLENMDRGDGVWSCALKDALTGHTFSVNARAVVLAVGPWLDAVAAEIGLASAPRLRPTKGVHIVIPRERLPLAEGVLIHHPDDHRLIFAIPRDNAILIGTTDTDHPEPSPEPEITDADIEYLLGFVNHYFPETHTVRADIFSAYAGLRPLLFESDVPESKIAREHKVIALDEALFGIAGGKLTTWRVMAEDVMDEIASALATQGRASQQSGRLLIKRSLPGGAGLNHRNDLDVLTGRLIEHQGIPPESARWLVDTYGNRSELVVNCCREHDQGMEVLGPSGVLAGAVIFSICHEQALTLDDILRRRLSIYFRDPGQGQGIAEAVAKMAAGPLGWSTEETARQVKGYLELCFR